MRLQISWNALVVSCACLLALAGTTASVASTFDCLEVVGRSPYGPASSVVASGTYVYFGSGAVVQIADHAPPSSAKYPDDLLLAESALSHDVLLGARLSLCLDLFSGSTSDLRKRPIGFGQKSPPLDSRASGGPSSPRILSKSPTVGGFR